MRQCTDAVEWQSFLQDRDRTLFHRWEWNAAFESYGLNLERFAAYDRGRIVGILPLVRQKGRIFGEQFVSLPWFDYTGVLADSSTIAAALIDRVAARVHSEPDAVLQIRQLHPLYSLTVEPVCRLDKMLMRLPLPKSPKELWQALKPKVRNQIRKAEKSGIGVIIGGPELVDEFYNVYAHNMRDLGSPSHSLRFFEAICRAFPAEVKIAVARLSDKTVGAGFTLSNGTALEIPWGSSLPEYNALCINHAMYWQLLANAAEAGYDAFHFGRSTVDSGTYSFKKQWGAVSVQLFWYHSSGNASRAVWMARPVQAKFGFAQQIWSRLPVPLTKILGPLLIARIP